MTSNQQVTAELNNAYDKFQNEIYNGKVEVPKDIIELFKKGVMALSSFSHKLNFYKVKVISGMKGTELTNMLINDVIKVVLNTPLDKLYPDSDFEQAILSSIEFGKFVIAYNEHIDDFRKKLEMRKATLDSFSTMPNGNKFLKIVN